MKKTRLIVLILLVGLTGVVSGVRGGEAPKRPNILFVIADDIGRLDFSAYGSTFIKTPNFDRIAEKGVLFSNCYTTNPKCSPSRATILTGRNTWELEDSCNHFGIFWNKFKVYPDLLEAAGYHIGTTGKAWWPGDFKTGGFTRNPAGPSYNKARLVPPTSGISAVDYTENFKLFLDERKPNQPFYFWFGCHEAHRAFEFGSGRKVGGKKLEDAVVPPYFPDDEAVREDLLDYAFEVEWFDQHLGNMIRILEENGEFDNTLIVVTSDNGMAFPRVKGQIYDDDFHMPLAACWGSKMQGGRVVDDYVSFTDFAPTFLEVAGIKPEHKITGKSILDILRSEKSGQIDPARDFIVVGKERHDLGRPDQAGYPVRAIRTDKYLYAVNFEPDRWPACDPPHYGNIDGSPTKTSIIEMHEAGESTYWELAMGKRPEEELYRMSDDTHCMNNLADNPELDEIKAEMRQELFKLLTEQEDPRVLGTGDVFDQYKYGIYRPAKRTKRERAELRKRRPAASPLPNVALSDLKPLGAAVGWDRLRVGENLAGQSISIEGRSYKSGLLAHAPSELEYALEKNYTRFVAGMGVDDSKPEASVVFKVQVGEDVLAKSPVLEPGLIWYFDVEIPSGQPTIKLIAEDAGDGNTGDHAAWVDAGFITK